MNNRRIFIGLQHFAEGEGDGGASANVPGNQTADNGGDAQDNASSQKPTFDDMLKDKDMQSEIDKRVSKALETAKTKWQKDADEKLSEAKKLEKMNAEQKAEYQRKQTEEKLAKREAEVTRRELMAEANFDTDLMHRYGVKLSENIRKIFINSRQTVPKTDKTQKIKLNKPHNRAIC